MDLPNKFDSSSVLGRQLSEGLMWACMGPYRDKVKKAQRDISEMLHRATRSYVTCSWGKQSIVVAHMVFNIDRDIPAVFWSGVNTEILDDFESTSVSFLKRFPMNYQRRYEYTTLKEAGEEYTKECGKNGVFMGLAANESKARAITLKDGNQTIYRYKNGTYRCCPIAAWDEMDLSAYIAVNRLPLLASYHKYGLQHRTAARSIIGRRTERGRDFLSSAQRAALVDETVE